MASVDYMQCGSGLVGVCIGDNVQVQRAIKASKAAFFRAARAWQHQELGAMLGTSPEFLSLRDEKGRTALHEVARQPLRKFGTPEASVAAARILLDTGADINAVRPIEDDGEVFPATALWYALAWGRNRPLATFLLKRGANPNHCLFAMAWADDLEAAKLLQKHGCEIDEISGGETPLIYAVRHRRAGFCEWLLRQGADPRARDSRGFTALHHAARRRLPDETLRLLVKSGADRNAAANDGTSVADQATRAQRKILGLP